MPRATAPAAGADRAERTLGRRQDAVVWIDGGARGNPGPAGCGAVIEAGDGHTEEHTLFLGVATNNEAEYAGLIAALARSLALGVERVEVRSDSELLVRQITGQYRVKAPNLQPLWQQARELAARFASFSIRHVRRAENARADRLANRAMDSETSSLAMPSGALRRAGARR